MPHPSRYPHRSRRLGASLAIALTGSFCNSAHDSACTASDAGGARASFHPDASCPITIDEQPLQSGIHVAIPSDIEWCSNPPSSGQHYPIWAAYRAYASPVPRGYYVHDLEHGAIVLLYKCAGDPGCAGVAAQLQAVSDAIPDDPLCAAAGGGVRVRTVITPDPLIDSPVAAAAWGWTYTADCLDLPSLEQFALAHYGHGPEALCADGTATFSP